MFDSNGYPIKRYYYKEDLSTNSVQYFYPGTDKVMKDEYNIDFRNFKRDYRQFYEDGMIQEEGHMKGGEVVFSKEYYKNRQLKCVKRYKEYTDMIFLQLQNCMMKKENLCLFHQEHSNGGKKDCV